MGEIRKRVVDQHDQLQLIGVCEPDEAKRPKGQGSCGLVRLSGSVWPLARISPLSARPTVSPLRSPFRCLRRGVHVFCEKPPGRNVQDILDMRAAEHPVGEADVRF
jgi:hypothetical protein